MHEGMESSGGGGGGIVVSLIYLVVFVVIIAGLWKVYTKAGEPGWAAIVPIYGQIVLLKIVGKPAWWIILFFIPVVSIIVTFIVMLELAKRFGKSSGFGVGLVFLSPVFIPMLGFGSATYLGGSPSPAPGYPVPAR